MPTFIIFFNSPWCQIPENNWSWYTVIDACNGKKTLSSKSSVYGLIPLKGHLLFTFCVDLINDYLLFAPTDQKHVKINNTVITDFLTKTISPNPSWRPPKSAKIPSECDSSGQLFLQHELLGTFHEETLGPMAKKEETHQ